MRLRRKAQEAHAQERIALDIEGPARLGLQERHRLGLAPARQILQREGHGAGVHDDLRGRAVDFRKARAQDFVALDQRREGRFQRAGVEIAVETERGRNVVGGAVRFEPA